MWQQVSLDRHCETLAASRCEIAALPPAVTAYKKTGPLSELIHLAIRNLHELYLLHKTLSDKKMMDYVCA